MRFGVEVDDLFGYFPTIEEAKDVAKLTLDDLLGSLQTYEMNLNVQTKDKNIALNVRVNNSDNVPYIEKVIMVLIGNFGKLLRKSSRTSGLETIPGATIKTRGIPISKELTYMLKEKVMNQHRKGKAFNIESVMTLDTYKLSAPICKRKTSL